MMGHGGGSSDCEKGIGAVVHSHNICDALHHRAAPAHCGTKPFRLGPQAQFLRLLPEISAPLLDVLCRKNTADDREAAHFPALQLTDIVGSDASDRDHGN